MTADEVTWAWYGFLILVFILTPIALGCYGAMVKRRGIEKVEARLPRVETPREWWEK
jgi:hypothetical protein